MRNTAGPFPGPHDYTNEGVATRVDHQVVIASGLNLLLGLWLIVDPFVLLYSSAVARSNDMIVGIIVGTLAAIRVFGAYREAWVSWLNAILGVWLIVAPFVLGYSGLTRPLWNDVIVGVLVAVFGAWSAWASR